MNIGVLLDKEGGIGHKEEDINTMHRYRDAILYRNKENGIYKSYVVGAFVLFPYGDDEKFRERRFYKSIKEVNIGVIPFLSSTTNLMEEFLNEIIMVDELKEELNIDIKYI